MLLNHKDLTLEESEAVSNALETFRKRPALGTFDRNLGRPEGAQRL